MADIPKTHPRYHSLMLRERLAFGLDNGLTSKKGLIAHGRGEAFYYMLGEKTHDFARESIDVSLAMLVEAERPIISVNGNTTALASDEIIDFAYALIKAGKDCAIEVNIFTFTKERADKICKFFTDKISEKGYKIDVLISRTEGALELPDIEHNRRFMHPDGLGRADVALVMLEDGDRCEALANSGRKVISVDLNPMSRSATKAHVNICDELTRCLVVMTNRLAEVSSLTSAERQKLISDFDSEKAIKRSLKALRESF